MQPPPLNLFYTAVRMILTDDHYINRALIQVTFYLSSVQDSLIFDLPEAESILSMFDLKDCQTF